MLSLISINKVVIKISNDTTTLNGALQELGETMAANITAKGVSASASDGLTTLAGKISQITGGGGTCPVTFENQGTTFNYTRKRGNNGFTVTIPTGTTTLGDNCFYYCYGLKEVTIPNTVTTIDNQAFYSCTGLTSISIPSSVTSLGSYCFYNCTGLTSITLPSGITTIPASCFYQCTALTSVDIPNTVTRLESRCFRYCSGLEEITIPSSVTSMSSYVFGNCTGLEKIRFESATPPSAGTGCFQSLPTTCVIEVPCDSLSLYTSASNYPSSSTYTYVPYGCNGLKFGSDSYATSTGSCELSLRLWDNNAPVSGGTITITGSDSSTYTCTTDSNGEATCTVSNVTGTVTFTATYSSYSATCTVTATTTLLLDDCSSSAGLSNYGSTYAVFERSSTNTLTFNTDEYLLAGSTCCFSGREVLSMSNVANATIRIKFKLNTTSSAAYNQFGIMCTDVEPNSTKINRPYCCRVRNDGKAQYFDLSNETTFYTRSNFSNDWYYLECTKNGTSWTTKVYDSSLNLLGSDTRTSLTAMTGTPKWYFYLLTDKGTNYSVHIKEVKAEPV